MSKSLVSKSSILEYFQFETYLHTNKWNSNAKLTEKRILATIICTICKKMAISDLTSAEHISSVKVFRKSHNRFEQTINQFHATGLFLYTAINHQKTFSFFYVYRGYRKRPVICYGLIDKDPSLRCSANREYSWKKTQVEKKI